MDWLIEPGAKYRHSKGKEYGIVCLASHSEIEVLKEAEIRVRKGASLMWRNSRSDKRINMVNQ